MKFLKSYKLFESSESLQDIKDYIDDILLPLEETNYVRVIDYTRYKKIDDYQPKIDINHIKVDIACDLEQENAFMGNDDFKLSEDNLSDIKSLYNYMVDSAEWDCKFIKSKYYSLREGTSKDDYIQLSKEFKDINEFEEWYKTNCENGEDLLKGITLFFTEYPYMD